MKETAKARQLMDSLELSSKYFALGVHGDNTNQLQKQHGNWYKAQDLQHSDQINQVGLRGTDSQMRFYNRDKYGKKTTSHQYAVIGDPLKTGMDFNGGMAANAKKTSYYRAKNPDWKEPSVYMKHSSTIKPLAIDLPPNIQHTYGSNICRLLLNDKETVSSAIQDQEDQIDTIYKKRRIKHVPASLPPEQINPNYKEISQYVRCNVFPGPSHDNKTTTNSTVHNQDVYDRRLPDPDEYRCRKDDLSKNWLTLCSLRVPIDFLLTKAHNRVVCVG